MASKLCPHSIKPTAEAKLLVQAGCPLVKFVDDFGAAEEYLALRPDLTIIGRGYTYTTLLDQLSSGDAPEQAAAKFVREQKARYYDPNPLIKIWEGHNEPSFGGPDESGALAKMEWYGRFEAARLRLLADLGLRGVVGNFSTGYPEINAGDLRMWEAFMPAVAAARDYNGMVGLHEYSSPWMWWLTGNYQEGNCLHRRLRPGWREEDYGDLGWLTLRYRQVYRYALAPHALDRVPLVITELGCDAVGHNCPGTASGAWKDLTSFWNSYDGSRDPINYWRQPGGERDAERYYAEQLIWYDREMQKDPFVLGATIFTFGTNSATWEPYNVAGTRVPHFLAAHISQARSEPTIPPPTPSPPQPPAPPQPVEIIQPAPSPAAAPAPPPTPVPAPMPAPRQPRGQPREQYSRIYVLLPPAATDPAWVEAIADATWADRRFTIGASADDAGIGNLHARMVVAINPRGWGTTPTIEQWLGQNYPGVEFVPVPADSPTELARTLRSLPLKPPLIARPGGPQTPLGQPLRQYERTYILFNPNHGDPKWIKAVARAAWARRVTMGGSADDAGIGDLDARRVIVLNPREGYDQDIFAWFDRHYPGALVLGVEGKTPDELAAKVKTVLGL